MKLKLKDDYQISSNSQMRLKTKIDDSALHLVMDMLAKNYNHPIPSAIREYVVNGLDAHKEINLKKPVELTLPDDFNEEIKIRDFGKGLSLDEIINIYANFGSSSKRDSDELIGGFGIGSKSGLAISDMISVTSVKDGLKNIFTLNRDNGGIFVNILLKDFKTDEESGTLIQIPHKTLTNREYEEVFDTLNGISKNDLTIHCENTYKDILNNHRIPDISKEFKNFYFLNNKSRVDKSPFGMKYLNGKTISVSNILYSSPYGSYTYLDELEKIENDILDKKGISKRFSVINTLWNDIIIKLPIKDAYISYSREELDNNDKLKKSITKIYEKAIEETLDYITNMLSGKKSAYERLKAISSIFPQRGKNFTYKDKSLEELNIEEGQKNKDVSHEYVINPPSKDCSIQRDMKTHYGLVLSDVDIAIIYPNGGKPLTLKDKKEIKQILSAGANSYDKYWRTQDFTDKIYEKLYYRNGVRLYTTKSEDFIVSQNEIIKFEDVKKAILQKHPDALNEPKTKEIDIDNLDGKPIYFGPFMFPKSIYHFRNNMDSSKLLYAKSPAGEKFAELRWMDLPQFFERDEKNIYTINHKGNFNKLMGLGAKELTEKELNDIMKKALTNAKLAIEKINQMDLRLISKLVDCKEDYENILNYFDIKTTLAYNTFDAYMRKINRMFDSKGYYMEYLQKYNISVKEKETPILPEAKILNIAYWSRSIAENDKNIELVLNLFKDRFNPLKDMIEFMIKDATKYKEKEIIL